MHTYAIETTFDIKYTTEKPVPISEVIKSLKSLEKLLLRTGPFVEKAFPGVHVVDMNVYISEIHSGSLSNKFIVKYVLGGEENAAKLEELIHKIMEDSKPVKTVVAMGVGAAMLYGIQQIIPKGEPSKAIEAHNSVIIQAGNDVNLDKQSIQEILESIKDKKSLAKEAVDAFHPAKGDDSAIEFGGLEAVSMPKAVVQSVPDEYEPPAPDEKEEKYKNVVLMISASDRDNTDKGWAGVAPGVVDNRVKMELSDKVNPKELHGRVKVNADITVHSKYVKTKKQYQPVMIEINAIH